MKSIFEDNNYSFSTFITSTTHNDGYAALIYRDEVTDDYSQKEQPIQSLFFHYLEPQSSGQAGEFTDYVGMEFFTGHGKTPLLALADASEQCEAYYKAQKENVEVAMFKLHCYHQEKRCDDPIVKEVNRETYKHLFALINRTGVPVDVPAIIALSPDMEGDVFYYHKKD